MKEVIEECKRQLRLSEEYDVEVKEDNQIRVKKDNKIQLFPFVVSDNKIVNFYKVSQRNNKVFICMIPEDGSDIKHKNVKSRHGHISKNRNQVKKQVVVLGMVMATAMLTLFPAAAKGIMHKNKAARKKSQLAKLVK